MRTSIIALSFLLAGCVTDQATDQLQSQWLGKPFDQFVLKHGAPKGSAKLADGRTVYDWEDRYDGTTITGAQVHVGCAARIVVARGAIESIEATKDTLGRFTVSRCAEVLRPA